MADIVRKDQEITPGVQWALWIEQSSRGDDPQAPRRGIAARRRLRATPGHAAGSVGALIGPPTAENDALTVKPAGVADVSLCRRERVQKWATDKSRVRLCFRQSVARDDPLGCRCARRSLPSRIRRVVAHSQCGAGAGLKGHLVRDSELEAAGALPLLADARLPFPACRSAGCAANSAIMSRSQSSFSCVASG